MSTTIATAISNAASPAVNNKLSQGNSEFRLNGNTTTMTIASTYHNTTHTIQKETKTDDPLPSDLKRILSEVAQNGGCAWLSWSTEQQHQNYFHNNNSYRFHIKRSPPRRRRKNGISNKRKRTGSVKLSSTSLTLSSGTTATSSSSSSPVARSLAFSGSELEDSNTSQYECDSEGTSSTKTTNSEISEGKQQRRKKLASTLHQNSTSRTRYPTLANAVSSGISFVLDHYFRHYGGYKPTSAEVCQYKNSITRAMTTNANDVNSCCGNSVNNLNTNGEISNGGNAAAYIFQQRRQRLINSVLRRRDGPPFTIQRLAEVMVSPYRFYKQTHKLCNCLEKLLLVTSSIHAFGGSTGGTTSQSRREERELAALADERERQEKSEQRNRRRRAKAESTSLPCVGKDASETGLITSKRLDENLIRDEKTMLSTPNEVTVIQAEAKEALRHKFERAVLTPDDDTSLPTVGSNTTTTKLPIRAASPPPPSLLHNNTPKTPPYVTHGNNSNNQQIDNSIEGVARAPSPILFSSEAARLNSSERNVHLLQLHHAAAMAGVIGTGDSSSPAMPLKGAAPLDIVRIQKNAPGINSPSGSPVPSMGGASKDLYGPTKENNSSSKETSDADTEGDPSRSYASNSDIDDSESGDDVSLDDSASDRSDGSDSGFSTLGAAPNTSDRYSNYFNEPFSAARLMALNRKQQQQRLQQSRVQMLVGEAAHLKNNPLFHNNIAAVDGTEYQSGDSIDSTMAEDSGGSDSSSSDLAD